MQQYTIIVDISKYENELTSLVRESIRKSTISVIDNMENIHDYCIERAISDIFSIRVNSHYRIKPDYDVAECVYRLVDIPFRTIFQMVFREINIHFNPGESIKLLSTFKTMFIIRTIQIF